MSASPLPQDNTAATSIPTSTSTGEHARRMKIAELMLASAEQLGGGLDPRLRVVSDLYVAGEIDAEEFARRSRATMVV